MLRPASLVVCALLPAALALCGCQRREQIEQYSVPKPELLQSRYGIDERERSLHESGEPPGGESNVEPYAARMIAAIVPRSGRLWFFKLMGPDEAVAAQREKFRDFLFSVTYAEGTPRWSLPGEWSERGPGGGRFATIEVPTGGKPLELTVIPLGSAEGDEFLPANVNRWRGQLGLLPLDDSEVEQHVERITVDGAEAFLAEMAGTAADSGGMSASTLGRSPPPHPPLAAAGAPAADSPITYETPSGWKPGRTSSLRVAAFEIGDGEQQAEVTVIPLPPSGLLPNVIRWREQVGLPEIDEEQLQQETNRIVVAGEPAPYFELVGAEQTILVAMAVRGPTAWFFKLQGPNDLARREKQNFESFIASVTFK